MAFCCSKTRIQTNSMHGSCLSVQIYLILFLLLFPQPYHPGHFRAFGQDYFSGWNVFSHPLDFRISKQKSTHNLREVLSSLSKVHPVLNTLYHIIALYLFSSLFINLNIILLVFILTLFLGCEFDGLLLFVSVY